MILSHGWLIFGIYDYRVMVGWCLEHITIQSWMVLFMLRESVCISGINYHGLFSSSIMEYMEFEFRVYDIWL